MELDKSTILSGVILEVAIPKKKLYSYAYKFLRSEFVRVHNLAQMEINITHICVLRKNKTIVAAGTYVAGKENLSTVFDAAIMQHLPKSDPLHTTPRTLVAEWDAIALLPKDELALHFPGADIALLRKCMIDVIYASIMLLSAQKGDHLLTMIGSSKVADICTRIGFPPRYLGPGDETAIKAAFPNDYWSMFFNAHPRECYVLDVNTNRSAIVLTANRIIQSSGVSRHGVLY